MKSFFWADTTNALIFKQSVRRRQGCQMVYYCETAGLTLYKVTDSNRMS
jgi:hypothetical protein